MILRSYKKNIAEGLGFVIFSIVFAFVVRVIYFFSIDDLSVCSNSSTGGYLWKLLEPLFYNPIISLVGSTIGVAIIIVILAHINTKYVLIRRKTFLHIGICALLFSSHPCMAMMNASYISVIFVLSAISWLFGSYSSNRRSKSALGVSLILALGSMFAPSIILYFPVFWIGLAIMRCLDFRSFLASLFSAFCVYFPAYTYFLFTDRLNLFLQPFTSINTEALSQLPILNFDHYSWSIIGISIFLLVIIFIYNYMTNYKDKIRVRSLISFLNVMVVFALLCLLLVNIDLISDLFILLAVGTLLLTHFFSLAEEGWIAYMFYLSLLLYFAIIALPFVL